MGFGLLFDSSFPKGSLNDEKSSVNKSLKPDIRTLADVFRDMNHDQLFSKHTLFSLVLWGLDVDCFANGKGRKQQSLVD